MSKIYEQGRALNDGNVVEILKVQERYDYVERGLGEFKEGRPLSDS